LAQTNDSYEPLFGSQDQCAKIIKERARWDKTVMLIDFSRNFFHQVAITAGMDYARGDAVMIIDADLQDPPELMLEMIEKWKEGYEVVYAKRVKRKGETFFKKWSAHTFYRILRASTEINIPVDTGDFSLIDRKVCEEMKRIKERNRFVRGLVSWVGFRQTAVEYVRDERLVGETKYPLNRMIKLCMDGILSFSHKPLKLAIYSGLLISGTGFVYLVYVLYLSLYTQTTIKIWSFLISIMLVLNGFTLFILGILGEYIGRIYDETKGRPLYIVRDIYGDEIQNKQPI
jgi:polyisoprenyl-phosphate glycosyltransferase